MKQKLGGGGDMTKLNPKYGIMKALLTMQCSQTVFDKQKTRKPQKNDSFYLHVLVAADRILSSCRTHWGMTLTYTVFACEKEQE